MKIVAMGLAAAMLMGCGADGPDAAMAKKRAAQFQKHLDDVRHYLKDGESARFEKLFLSEEQDGTTALCGEVNAKNAFGAYVGFGRFVGVAGSALLEQATGKAGMDAVWKAACSNKVFAPE